MHICFILQCHLCWQSLSTYVPWPPHFIFLTFSSSCWGTILSSEMHLSIMSLFVFSTSYADSNLLQFHFQAPFNLLFPYLLPLLFFLLSLISALSLNTYFYTCCIQVILFFIYQRNIIFSIFGIIFASFTIVL